MDDVLLNTPLYHLLCASAQKWFETDRGCLTAYHVFKFGNGRSFSVDQACLGNKLRNIHLNITICTSKSVCAHYVMCLSLKFNDKIGIDFLNPDIKHSAELKNSVLEVINQLNNNDIDATISYSSLEDKIYVCRKLYFYPGSMPPEDEIIRLYDDFFLRDHIVKLAEIIEHNAWDDPLPYLYERLKDYKKQ